MTLGDFPLFSRSESLT